MFGKGSKIYAMITGCCPKCHEESMYLDGNPFNVMKIYAMHEKCSHCGQVYKIEPSFFFGAMFVSYGLGVWNWNYHVFDMRITDFKRL